MIDKQNKVREDSPVTWHRLRVAAIFALVIHLIAGLYMLVVLRNGLDTVEFAQRLSFLTNNNRLWSFGWLLWTAADFSILFFYFCFSDAHKKDTGLATTLLRYAFFIAIAGFALDLAAEVIEMSILPELARKIMVEQADISLINNELFLTANRLAIILTGFLANGLYSICAAMMIFATRERYSRLVQAFGYIAVLSGLYLSYAAYAYSVIGMFYANVVLMPALLAWLLGIAIESKAKSWKEKFVVKS